MTCPIIRTQRKFASGDISLLEEAVRRDPKFLRAYCLMCETNLDLYWSGFDHTKERRKWRAQLCKKQKRFSRTLEKSIG